MKSLIRNAWLLVSLAVAINASGPSARGNTFPVPEFPEFGLLGLIAQGPTQAGLDGNSRLVFNVYNSTQTQLRGSNLWILDPNGNFLAAASPSLPSTGGFEGLYNPILVQGQADGNTTVVFLFGNFTGLTGGITSIGIWTYNPSGQLIASATYGPYTNTAVTDLTWSQSTGKLLVRWSSGSGVDLVGGTTSAWTINEYGGIDTAAGPFGPFAGDTYLSKVILLKDGTQQWIWASETGNATATTAVWSVSPAGQVQAVQQFGPF